MSLLPKAPFYIIKRRNTRKQRKRKTKVGSAFIVVRSLTATDYVSFTLKVCTKISGNRKNTGSKRKGKSEAESAFTVERSLIATDYVSFTEKGSIRELSTNVTFVTMKLQGLRA